MARTWTGDVAERADVLRRQWRTLRDWVGDAVDTDTGHAPSILDGWTVADLVAHLGRAMDALAVCEPAPAGTVPLSLAEYLGSYAGRAADIDRVTRDLAAEIADDPLRHVDALAARALARIDELRALARIDELGELARVDELGALARSDGLGALSHSDRLGALARADTLAAAARADRLGPGDPVVLARRGPIRLSTMLISRLTELVVHADDLQRSLARTRGAAPGTRAELGDGIGPRPGVPGGLGPDGELGDGVRAGGPIDGDALDLVARELLRIVRARGGWDLEIVQPLTWVRLAAGRVPYDVDVLAAALAPRFTSDAVPDLGRMLPVL